MLLPPGKDVAKIDVTGKLESVSGLKVDLKQAPIFPQQKPVPIGQEPSAELEINPQIYESAELFPSAHFGGAAVLFIGVEAVAQHIPHVGFAGEIGECLVQ